jgi:hypothetical protein
MFTFILVAKFPNIPLSPEALLLNLGLVRAESDGRYLVESANRKEDGWICAYRDDDVISDFDPEEIAKLDTGSAPIAFFIVEGGYGSKMYADRFLRNLPTGLGYIIDNDHGCISSVEVFKKKLDNGEDWLQCDT